MTITQIGIEDIVAKYYIPRLRDILKAEIYTELVRDGILVGTKDKSVLIPKEEIDRASSKTNIARIIECYLKRLVLETNESKSKQMQTNSKRMIKLDRP